MRTRISRKPTVESLEERALLSHMVPHPHPGHAVQIASVRAREFRALARLGLRGITSGTYTASTSFPLPGANYNLTGGGTLASVGVVQVNGAIHLGLVGVKPRPAGSVTITNSQGSIRLSLQTVGGFMPLAAGTAVQSRTVIPSSIALRYTIVGGTGAFRRLHGTGSVNLSLNPNSNSGVPLILSGPGPVSIANPGNPAGSGPLPITVPPGGTVSGGVPSSNSAGSGSAVGVRPISVGTPTFLSGQFTLDFHANAAPPKIRR